MASNAPKKALSLLDALDQSFMNTDPPAAALPLQATLLQRNPLQNPDSRRFAEAGPSSSQKSAALDALRAAQRVHEEDVTNAAPSLSQSIHSLGNAGRGGGFKLNYDVETPLRAIDVGGPDQEQRLADFVTKSIENTGQNVSVKDAMRNLGLKDNRDLLPGVEVRLLSHQAIGVAWMLDKEQGSDRGGILADEMGLGKTVQMIATMAMNMPKMNDDCRTTLIVVPAALLQQWKDEIDTKTNGLFTVHIHHSKDKLKKASQLKSIDVVITSYQTLCQDFSTPKDIEVEEEEEWLASNGGLFSQVRFYRVIADEAQFIRNRATRSSVSLSYLKAKYRWMLTGTPVTNTLADIYGLLRFGRFRPWNDWNSFNEHVAKVQSEDAPLAGSRAQAILKPILLRRTKNSSLEGKPLLQLPPKEIEIVNLQFTPEERELYESFERRTKIQVNRFIKEGTLVKNHAFVLVLILRLRQMCCHPHLILSLAHDYEDPTMLVGTDSDKELSRARKIMGPTWVADVKKRFLLRAIALENIAFADEVDDPEATCGNCNDLFMNGSGRILTCKHEICFDCTLDLSNSPIAHDGIFGTGTEKENLEAEKEYEAAAAKGHRPCPTCKKMMDMKAADKVFKSAAFEPTDEEISNHKRAKKDARRAKYEVKTRSPSPTRSIPDELDDSDDDLPDMADMLKDMLKKPSKKVKDEDEDMLDVTQPRPSSSKLKKKRKVIDSSDSEVEVVDDSISQGKRRKSGGGSSPPHRDRNAKGKGRAGTAGEDGGPSEALVATWSRGDDDLEPSTKMQAMIDLLREWENEGDKTIIYSQWTSMLDLIETLFSRHSIRSLRFDGKMGRTERDATLKQFRQPGGPKVILISTKCGSVGLNLVSANRIINMDLSWNYAAESQAYDRCHRIGQEKPVFVKRLVVENTIEERMLRLQDVKTGLAEAALGEGTGAKLHKLSVKDIKYLFGMGPTNNSTINAQGGIQT